MIWLEENLIDGFKLFGIISDNVVELYIEHPAGNKTLKVKHIGMADYDNINIDDIRKYFSNTISKITSKTTEQLYILCNIKL